MGGVSEQVQPAYALLACEESRKFLEEPVGGELLPTVTAASASAALPSSGPLPESTGADFYRAPNLVESATFRFSRCRSSSRHFSLPIENHGKIENFLHSYAKQGSVTNSIQF